MKNYFGFPAGHLANFVLPIAFIVQCLQNRVPTSLIKLRKENQTFNKALPSPRCEVPGQAHRKSSNWM